MLFAAGIAEAKIFSHRDKPQPEVHHNFRRIQPADKIFLPEIPQNKFGAGSSHVSALCPKLSVALVKKSFPESGK